MSHCWNVTVYRGRWCQQFQPRNVHMTELCFIGCLAAGRSCSRKRVRKHENMVLCEDSKLRDVTHMSLCMYVQGETKSGLSLKVYDSRRKMICRSECSVSFTRNKTVFSMSGTFKYSLHKLVKPYYTTVTVSVSSEIHNLQSALMMKVYWSRRVYCV